MSCFDESGNLLVDEDDPGHEECHTEVGMAGGDGPAVSRRGTKRGTKRGPYNRDSIQARKRIPDSFYAGGDWKMTAITNGVAVQIAYNYIR